MGNTSAKKETDPAQKSLDELFSVISNRKGHILRSDLRRAWEGQIDQDLYNNVELYLFRTNHNELTSQTFKRFFNDICKGGLDEKVDVVHKLLGNTHEISKSNLLKFIMSILNSILIIQKNKSTKGYTSWTSRMTKTDARASLQEYGEYYLEKIHKSEDEEYTKSDLQLLLNYFDFFLHVILCQLYGTEGTQLYAHIFPKWKGTAVDQGKSLEQFSVFNYFTIMFLNLELPVDYQNEWRPLFSSKVDGESFSRLSSQIANQGPTVIVVKDREGHIFGGFAPDSWSLGPNFRGDSRSFLFTLHPKMNLYPSTHFNENFQYMNIGQQTMPNGLGMGGKLEYFGLWIDAEYGIGSCSESCTTYRDYKMMSAKKYFVISHLEVWGVGPPPPSPADLGERSVLDGNLDAKAMLEMAGKKTYSDGLREDIDQ